MCDRICANCACAVRAVGRWHRVILSRWPGLLMCMNHPEAPGQLQEVTAHGTCRNFRAKPKPVVRLDPPEPPNDEVRYIALTKGKFAIVDKADYEWLSEYTWQAAHNGTKFYATTKKKRNGTIWMHRLIMNAPKGMVVDHINGNGLDNRRCNLRLCTRQQNAYNSKRCKGTSKYKGVHFERATGKWRATITCKGEHYNLGLYDNEVEAARAYDRKAIELFGEFAYLNFPDEHAASQRAEHVAFDTAPGSQ